MRNIVSLLLFDLEFVLLLESCPYLIKVVLIAGEADQVLAVVREAVHVHILKPGDGVHLFGRFRFFRAPRSTWGE